MKYISLFSGIGGFEVAIHRVFPEAECLGYSEIKPAAIKVYQHHFPDHYNLGDITQITDEKLVEITRDGCDMVVGGFPCTNLSSLAALNGDHSGLEGAKSGLLYEMLRVLRVVKPKYFIAENNFSMKKSDRKLITQLFEEIFSEIHVTMLNAADFGVQTRKRLFWTNFPVEDYPKVCTQTWDDVLEPLETVKHNRISDNILNMMNQPFRVKNDMIQTRVAFRKKDYYIFQTIELKGKTRWEDSRCSDTMKEKLYTYPINKSRPITAGHTGGNNILIDRRSRYGVLIRDLTVKEKERLMRFDDDYTDVDIIISKRSNLLGNAVVPVVIEHILENL